MAGGKETPRQKMIGMMYLVLTALLALNVSKEIINAFVTLDNKVAQGVKSTDQSIQGWKFKFEAAKVDPGQKESAKEMESTWNAVNMSADSAVDFLLREAHEMVTTADPENNWLVENEAGFAIDIEPLGNHNKKDDYDTPTNLFVGDDPASPNDKGWALAERVHSFRDNLLKQIGNRQADGKQWSIEIPADTTPEAFQEAFKNANPKDQDILKNLYRKLTVPETVMTMEAGDEVEQPWQVASFYHTPVVAANALIRALVADVRSAHSDALSHLYSRLDNPLIKINKIEPQTIARTSYVNQGDELGLRVTLAAFDSTEVYPLRYAFDGDTAKPVEEWTLTDSTHIALPTKSASAHKVKGQMQVKTARGIKWEPFEFTYGVGAPQGVISLMDLNILYRGYPNRVQGTASGYDPSMIQLKGTGVSLQKNGDHYVATPQGRGRTATISVVAEGAKLGQLECQVKNLPNPELFIDGNGQGSVGRSVLTNARKITAGYGPDVPLDRNRVKFTVKDWKVQVQNADRRGSGTDLGAARSLMRQLKPGMLVSVMATVKGPDGVTRKIGGTYEVK